jgi:putative glutamine amidotransferase
MSLILVPSTTKPDPHDIYVFRAIRDSYIQVFSRHGLVPILVSPGMTQQQIVEAYLASSGVFLMGGPDINPLYYGERPGPHTDVADPQRSALELSILERVLIDQKPCMGICLGNQTMAVAAGAKLHQHLPDLPIAEVHGISEHVHGGDPLPEHLVTLNPGGRLHKIFNAREMVVNSAHHQAIRSPLPKGYRVSAVTKGKVIEAFERESDHFYMGIQWHAERMGASMEPLFAAYAAECKKFRHDVF